MKVKVTITGTLDLSKGDVRALREASAEQVMNTLLDNSDDIAVELEGPEERAAAAKTKAEVKAKAETEAADFR